MSHHAHVPPSEKFLDRFNGLIHKQTLEQMKTFQEQSLGATGEFPRGKIDETDEGEIRIAIASDPDDQTVMIEFGKQVAWIGFTPEQAVGIAEMLIKHARGVSKSPLVVEI